MVGKGEASAVPDELSFALAVGATRDDLETALADASRTMDRVLGSLTAYGVAKADVQTTGLSMYPVYDYHSYGPPTLRGYKVNQRARVLVKDLKQGGKAVSAAVAAGGNAVRVNDIRLQVGDPDAVMAKARAAAVKAATAKAEQYAAAAGQDLGDVLTLKEVTTSNRSALTNTYELNGLMDRAAAALPVPIRAGKDDLGVTVQVVWEFE
nr:SIMPL domain-containing protein [Nocardioides luti]